MKAKKTGIIVVCSVLVVIYFTISIIPNIFMKKGFAPDQIKRLQIIAHRGGANMGLENTLSCIEKGISSGADMIEIDIHLTKDNHLLVCHDESVDRTTNGSGKIAEMTMAELQELRIVDRDGNITNEHLPTLKEVLSLVNGRVKLLIEIKKGESSCQGIEQKLMDEIDEFQAASWVVVQSFSDSVLEKLHQIAPSQRLEKLIIFKFFGLPFIFDGSITRFSFKKYHHISSFNIFHKSARRSWINNIHKQGKEVKIWTLDGPEDTPNLSVEGIITDRPDLWNP